MGTGVASSAAHGARIVVAVGAQPRLLAGGLRRRVEAGAVEGLRALGRGADQHALACYGVGVGSGVGLGLGLGLGFRLRLELRFRLGFGFGFGFGLRLG